MFLVCPKSPSPLPLCRRSSKSFARFGVPGAQAIVDDLGSRIVDPKDKATTAAKAKAPTAWNGHHSQNAKIIINILNKDAWNTNNHVINVFEPRK